MQRSQDSNQSPQPNSRQLSHPTRWQLQCNNLNTVIRVISTRVRTNGLLHVRHKVGRRRATADLGHLVIKVWHQSQLRVFPIRQDSIWRRHRLKLVLLQSLDKRTCLIRAIRIHCRVVFTWCRKAKMITISSGSPKIPQPKVMFLRLFPRQLLPSCPSIPYTNLTTLRVFRSINWRKELLSAEIDHHDSGN